MATLPKPPFGSVPIQVSDLPKTRGKKVCPKCGSTILPDAPNELCSICLFKVVLAPMPWDGEGEHPESGSVQLGDYELLNEIGRGGQGSVFRARQKSLNRIVALKVIGMARWATEAHLRRFRAEAEAAARLNHPSIVPIHDIREDGDCCYFSMRLLEGASLEDAIGKKPISVRRAAELIAKLARTVHYAHEHGILHRDIKPGNVLLDEKGEPYLTDFGLARLIEPDNNSTRSVETLGTPSYMAPEQANGSDRHVGCATDVYGLGAVFYHLLTGHPPFSAESTYETIKRVLESDPVEPRRFKAHIDRDLSTICLKCLEKDPARRYPSALSVAEDIERWLRNEPILARRNNILAQGSKWIARNRSNALGTAAFLAALIAITALVWKDTGRSASPGIAVLPFDNLSANNEDEFLATGLQDDILTKLAKISRLKVISRTSVMAYRPIRDVRQIGRALNVSYVLEGSVRRELNRVHINTQLINARSDAHVWSESFDVAINDLFVTESKIVESIAAQLRARITPDERAMIESAATADIVAFDLYTRARDLFLRAANNNSGKQDLLEAAGLLNRAVQRDPNYLEAHCQAARIHDLLYILGHDHTPRRLKLADVAIQAALTLRPQAPEAHLARADYLYSAYLDYSGALSELEQARKILPNDSRIAELTGLIKSRQGKPAEAVSEFEHAMKLDPRNVYRLQQIALTHWKMRNYGQARAAYDRALAIDPDNVQVRIGRADLDLPWKADTQAVHEVIDSIRSNNPGAIREVADSWVVCALADRDPVAAKAALIAAGENTPFNDDAVHFSRPFVEGWIAQLENDPARVRAAFEAARREQEKIVQSQPDYAPSLCVLGVIDAMLGRKEEALSEGRRAIELLPVEKDAFNGPLMIQWHAISAAWLGEKDLALDQLAATLRVPGILGPGYLKLLPFWDPLRGDPRFEQIIASLASK